ncbi:MAG TPA: hypothetical protein VIN11_04160 [Roseivirga sp.]
MNKHNLKHLFLYAFLIITSSTVMAQQQVKAIEERLLTGELKSFRGEELRNVEIRKLARQFSRIEGSLMNNTLVLSSESQNTEAFKLSETLISLASEYNLTAVVQIESFPQQGANIKYQSVADRLNNKPPITVNGLSNTQLTLTYGIYYIWTERNGVPTSNNQEQRLIISNDTIQIIEKDDL